MALTLRIGTEQSTKLIPVADAVLCKLTTIQPNKYKPDEVLDFGYLIIDFDYDGSDDETNAEIQALAEDEFTYWERYNLPTNGDDLGKRTKLYKHLKGMRGGRDIETGEEIDLNDHLAKNFRIDFEHDDKKGPPPDFAVARDDKGNAIQKNVIAKIRPERKTRTQAPKPAPVEDADLYDGDDDEE